MVKEVFLLRKQNVLIFIHAFFTKMERRQNCWVYQVVLVSFRLNLSTKFSQLSHEVTPHSKSTTEEFTKQLVIFLKWRLQNAIDFVQFTLNQIWPNLEKKLVHYTWYICGECQVKPFSWGKRFWYYFGSLRWENQTIIEIRIDAHLTGYAPINVVIVLIPTKLTATGCGVYESEVIR